MNLLSTYIFNFLKRSGGYIFISTILARVLSFVASWLALHFIDNKSLGEVLYAWTIISFLVPLVGLGLHQSYIRYGALKEHHNDKDALLNYVLKYGTIASAFLTVFVLLLAFTIPFKLEHTSTYLGYFSLVFIPFFGVEMLKTKARLFHKNKLVAQIDILYHIILITLVGILSYCFQEMGYVWALLLTPVMVIIRYNPFSFYQKQHYKPSFITKDFWKYGIFGGLSNVATMLLFAIDILLIGYLMNDSEMVTAFRYISLIPFSILFLPRVFMTTDFVTITENIMNPNFVYKYIKSYLLLFSGISFFFVGFFFLFSEETLSLFDWKFIQFKDSFLILNMGVCGVLLLRGLFGNLLSSIGLVKANYYITCIAILLNIISNYFLIPSLGIKGAAITSAFLLWFTGIMSALCFFYYYKKLTLH